MNSELLYSSIAVLYDLGLRFNGYKRAADFIVRQLPIKKSSIINVLDAGCGTGLYTIAMLKNFPAAKITAFDLNREMVKKLKVNLEKGGFTDRTKVFVGDINNTDPEIKDREFDIVITGGVLEYVDIKNTVNILIKHLKTGGYYLNSSVKANIFGKLVGIAMGFKPYNKDQNLAVFNDRTFMLYKFISIPFRYFPINLVKETSIFRKV